MKFMLALSHYFHVRSHDLLVAYSTSFERAVYGAPPPVVPLKKTDALTHIAGFGGTRAAKRRRHGLVDNVLVKPWINLC